MQIWTGECFVDFPDDNEEYPDGGPPWWLWLLLVLPWIIVGLVCWLA